MGWKKNTYTMYDIRKMNIDDLRRLTLEERADVAQTMYTRFQRIVNEAAVAGVVPYGVVKLYRDFDRANNIPIVNPDGSTTTLAEMYGMSLDKPITRNVPGLTGWRRLTPEWDRRYANQALLSYITMMKEFFSWKSSTVAGWNKIAEKQDIALFGADEWNRPLRRMSERERTAFWSTFEEIKKRGNYIYGQDGFDLKHLGAVWKADPREYNDIELLAKRMEKALNPEKPIPEFATGEGKYIDPFTGLPVDELEENVPDSPRGEYEDVQKWVFSRTHKPGRRKRT